MSYIKRPFQLTTTEPSISRDASHIRHLPIVASKTASPVHSSVRFQDSASIPQTCSDREKFLTAKYPPQQMQLIRKRLKVEFWLDDQLRFLYGIKDDSSHEDHNHCPGDLIDSLLDIDDDTLRRQFLLEKLRNAKQSRPITMEFIDELLHRVKLL